MRLFIIVTALMAIVAIPAYLLLDQGAARSVSQVARSADPLDAAISEMQKIAAGLSDVGDDDVAARLDVHADETSGGGLRVSVNSGANARATSDRPIVGSAGEHVAVATPNRDLVPAEEEDDVADVVDDAPATIAALDPTERTAPVSLDISAPGYARSSAAPGTPRAAFDLASQFALGRGLPKTYPTAFAWFEIA